MPYVLEIGKNYSRGWKIFIEVMIRRDNSSVIRQKGESENGGNVLVRIRG